jgi:HK97 family phage major capsid protein
MTLKELREKQATVVAQARERLDLIKTNTDESRSAELAASHDTAMAEFDRLEGLIKKEERQAEIEARFEERSRERRPTGADGEARGDGEQRSEGDDAKRRDEYRSAFKAMLLAGGAAAELSSEHRAALRAGAAEFRAQSTTNAAGGYTVPVTLANFIVKSMAAWGPMYDEDICTVISTASGEQINLPTIDDTAKVVVQHAEGVALTDDGSKDVVVGQKVLNAFLYDTQFIRWSLELMNDSAWNWEQLLADLLGERLGRRANTELTTGDGNGDPNGIVVASTLGKTAAGAAAITADELIDLQHSVDPAYRQSPKCRWQFNDGTLKAIRKLKDGQGNYLWQMGDVRGGAPASLLNHPYSVNQAMPAMTTGLKSVIFGDHSKYFVRKVGAPVIGVMRERFWPDLGIAGLIRLDGELADTAAVKHLIQA